MCVRKINIFGDTILGNSKSGMEKIFRITDLLFENVKLKTIVRIEKKY